MNNSLIVRLVLIWALLLVVLMSTRPEQLPLPLLVVPFILLWAGIYELLSAVLAGRQGSRLNKDGRRVKPFAAVLASTFVACMGLKSIGEFTLRDFITVVLFAVVAYFYATRNLRKSSV
ncbi:hypothetical protein JNM87_05445 [Candidatus Saccharibacteria bacterium]|nr:hypothetical protein [Candidatus Saccharibacteria bacterium]